MHALWEVIVRPGHHFPPTQTPCSPCAEEVDFFIFYNPFEVKGLPVQGASWVSGPCLVNSLLNVKMFIAPVVGSSLFFPTVGPGLLKLTAHLPLGFSIE